MFDYNRDKKYVLEVLENLGTLDYRLRKELGDFITYITYSLWAKKGKGKAEEAMLERVIDLVQILSSERGYNIFVAKECIEDCITGRMSLNKYLDILRESKKCQCRECAQPEQGITTAPLPLERVVITTRRGNIFGFY